MSVQRIDIILAPTDPTELGPKATRALAQSFDNRLARNLTDAISKIYGDADICIGFEGTSFDPKIEVESSSLDPTMVRQDIDRIIREETKRLYQSGSWGKA